MSPEDVAACEEKYNKSKMVHSIMRHVAETTTTSLADLYEYMAWPLYKKYGHAFEAFKHMVSSPDAILAELTRPDASGAMVPAVDDAVKDALTKDIRRRMTPQPLKIRADVELTCFAYDGVLHIKEAMRAAAKVSQGECKVKVSLVASPLYVITTQTLDKDFGVKLVDAAVEAATASILGNAGKIIVKEAARAVSERDDRLLAEKMEKLQKAQDEEDEDSGSEDETMGDIDIEKTGAALQM